MKEKRHNTTNWKRVFAFLYFITASSCLMAQRVRQGVDYDDSIPEISYRDAFILCCIGVLVFIIVVLIKSLVTWIKENPTRRRISKIKRKVAEEGRTVYTVKTPVHAFSDPDLSEFSGIIISRSDRFVIIGHPYFGFNYSVNSVKIQMLNRYIGEKNLYIPWDSVISCPNGEE